MSEGKKFSTVYITGIGHSGSTLLNLLLGTAKNAFSAGENKATPLFHEAHLFQYIKGKIGFPCDCGKDFKDCPLWKEVIKDIDADRLFPPVLSFAQKIRFLLHILLPVPFKVGTAEEEKLYNNILSEAKRYKNVDCIIDSSKNSSYLAHLNQVGLPVYAIHLVRDGRGVINSYARTGLHWFFAYLQWLFGNLLMRIMLKTRFRGRHTLVSYDKFAQRPEETIEMVNQKLGLDIDPKHYIANMQKEQYHNFAGNPTRWRGIDAIKYDQSWRRRMPRWKQWVLTVLCWIPNKLWVYNKKL